MNGFDGFTQWKDCDFLENIHLLAVSLDVQGRIIFCNNYLLTVTGWQREELVGRDWFDTFSPHGMRHELRKRYKEDISLGRIKAHYEEELTTYLGKKCLISWSTTLLHDFRGYVSGVTLIGRDVGLQRQIQKELRDAWSETEHLITSIPSVLIELSLMNRIIRWNTAAELTLGISAWEVLGTTFNGCPVRWESNKLSEGLQLCRQQKTAIRTGDVKFTRPDGVEGLLDITISPVTDEMNDLLALIILGSDVTERRLLERQLAQAQKLESIGQLAAGIAHEVNTPTQYVGDNTRFLLDAFGDLKELLRKYDEAHAALKSGAPGEDVLKRVEAAVEAADLEYLMSEIPKAIEQSLEGVGRVSKIVKAMREFSHPGVTEKTAVDINRAIESTITVARNEWKYVADMVTDFDPSLPLLICFPGELNQVILNLIINSAHAIADLPGRAAEEKGTITVSTRNLGERMEIRVSDTGTGIPESVRSKIFNPFFTTKEVGKGTGLGLSISHTVIVEKHEGSITFENGPGGGTMFIISLPLTYVDVLKGDGS